MENMRVMTISAGYENYCLGLNNAINLLLNCYTTVKMLPCVPAHLKWALCCQHHCFTKADAEKAVAEAEQGLIPAGAGCFSSWGMRAPVSPCRKFTSWYSNFRCIQTRQIANVYSHILFPMLQWSFQTSPEFQIYTANCTAYREVLYISLTLRGPHVQKSLKLSNPALPYLSLL